MASTLGTFRFCQQYSIYTSLWCWCISAICYARCCSNSSDHDFLSRHKALGTRHLTQGCKVNRLFRHILEVLRQTHWSSWVIREKCLPNVCCFCQLKWFTFYVFAMTKLIKLAKMSGVMPGAYHAYSIWSTWWLHRLAADAALAACVIESPNIFSYCIAKLKLAIWLVYSRSV